MTTVLNFGGTGTANLFKVNAISPAVSKTYTTIMTVEYLDNAYTFLINNDLIVRVSLTAFLNPNPPAGVWKSFIATANTINYTFNFTTDYKKCKVTYTGTTFLSTQFGTIENYDLLLT